MSFNTQRALQQLANLNPPTTQFDNKLMLSALALLNNPQHSYKVIHIAGTNGKGSTAAIIEEALSLAGYKVGKFSSPYLHRLNECIALNKLPISDLDLATLYHELELFLIKYNIYPSSFEMLTLIMFVFFSRQQIDYLVLETGMGGLNDATNVVNSQFSIITNIGLEHTQWLGNKLPDIAKHKAGIIKSGLTIIGANTPELITAVKTISPNYINIYDYYHFKSRLNYTTFTTQLEFSQLQPKMPAVKLELNLFGHFQAPNFLCAYTLLREIGLSLDLIKQAAQQVIWPGRLQKINTYPWVIADASHNANGSQVLATSLAPRGQRSNSVIICSILKDKNIEAMLHNYSQISDSIIFCNLHYQPRASSALHLAKRARHHFKYIYARQTPALAYQLARQMKKSLIIISGSTYLLKNFI